MRILDNERGLNINSEQQPRTHASGRDEDWNLVRLGLSVLTLFEAVGLKNEKQRTEKKGSPLFPLNILHNNPVICTDLHITERLELVTLPSCRHDWIHENHVNENFTLVKTWF